MDYRIEKHTPSEILVIAEGNVFAELSAFCAAANMQLEANKSPLRYYIRRVDSHKLYKI